MSSSKKKIGPINTNKSTRKKFNRYRNWFAAQGNKTVSQDDFVLFLLDLFEEKHPKVKNLPQGE